MFATHPRMLREQVGDAVGRALAPMFELVASARRSRVFHPQGVVVLAYARAIAREPRAAVTAERLRGPALVRFSTALWKKRAWPDALGCAIRFCASETPSVDPDPSDQDLLFATIRSPLTTLLGPIGVDPHDFLANTYFGAAPFDAPDGSRVKLRLVPDAPVHDGEDRNDRLAAAIEQGAALRLELRRTFELPWREVVRVDLERVVDLDQARLRFWPFREGRGVRPRGFVHALRRGAYRASQRA